MRLLKWPTKTIEFHLRLPTICLAIFCVVKAGVYHPLLFALTNSCTFRVVVCLMASFLFCTCTLSFADAFSMFSFKNEETAKRTLTLQFRFTSIYS